MKTKFGNSRHFNSGEISDLLRLRTYLLEHASGVGIPYDIRDPRGEVIGQSAPYEFGGSFKVELDTYNNGYVVLTVGGDNRELAMVFADKLEDIVVPLLEERRKNLRNKEGFIDEYLTSL